MIVHAWATVRYISDPVTDQRIDDAAGVIEDWLNEKSSWHGATDEQIREIIRLFRAFLDQA